MSVEIWKKKKSHLILPVVKTSDKHYYEDYNQDSVVLVKGQPCRAWNRKIQPLGEKTLNTVLAPFANIYSQ